jgi:hypothetical protein
VRAGADELARGTLSLRDCLAGTGAQRVAVPCEAGAALVGAAAGEGAPVAAGATVAELSIEISGADVLRALAAPASSS